ncbi:unnamed protein product [Acanthosepion pharaonis]|uniref:Secreted protein n=1 Tax=Acanthosepion pharaonis TaxID=158019 RepID=A0A812EX54_ACAPH|nr:unnamed protein product [Sepia pharaonis]
MRPRSRRCFVFSFALLLIALTFSSIYRLEYMHEWANICVYLSLRFFREKLKRIYVYTYSVLLSLPTDNIDAWNSGFLRPASFCSLSLSLSLSLSHSLSLSLFNFLCLFISKLDYTSARCFFSVRKQLSFPFVKINFHRLVKICLGVFFFQTGANIFFYWS